MADQWNSAKTKQEDGDGQQHIALFIEFIRQDTEAKTKDHANGQRRRHCVTHLVNGHGVLAIEIDSHEWQRCAAANG